MRDLRAAGFLAVVVGGSVRDALLGLEPKDFDIEVYGMSYDHLAAFLVGTASLAHLKDAAGAVEQGPLDPARLASLRGAFAGAGRGWSGRV